MRARTTSPSPRSARIDPDVVRGLLDALRRARDDDDPARVRALADRLVVLHIEVAHTLARRFHHRDIDDDDLVQVACVGLVKAAHRWDSLPENGFLPYALPLIDGELRRHLRDHATPVRLPRALHQLRSELVLAERSLDAAGRQADDRSVAEVAGVPLADVRACRAAVVRTRGLSLDALEDPDHGPWAVRSPAELDRTEDRAVLRTGLAVLDDRERRLVELRFVRDLTQAQIGRRLGISQMQVSRLLTAALQKLRTAIDPLSRGRVA